MYYWKSKTVAFILFNYSISYCAATLTSDSAHTYILVPKPCQEAAEAVHTPAPGVHLPSVRQPQGVEVNTWSVFMLHALTHTEENIDNL